MLILPITGLLVFAGESYRSVLQQRSTLKEDNACFCWSSIPLDTKPLNTSYEGFGRRNLTSCGYLRELNARTDLGCGRASLPTRLLVATALPAFLASMVIVRGLSTLGVTEVASFIGATPPLIFVWYYFVSRIIVRLAGRRKRRELATDC